MFMNPLMLAGLGGAAVPLVLHLLSRAQYRRVEWGAMMFLQADAFNELQSAKLKRWTLLGLRMLAVGLLAVALARPVVQVGDALDPALSRATAAIVVDCSGSMAYDEGGRTRMDLARGAVLHILSGLNRGDQAVLVPAMSATAQPQRDQHLMRPSGDLQAVATRVADLESAAGAANLADAITSALNVLERDGREGTRQLYVVCDRQASSWGNVTDSFVSAWRQRVAKTAGLSRFVVVPVGGEGNANVGVESIEMANLPVIRGIGNRIEVTLRNYGNQPRAGVAVTVTAEQRELLATSVNLPGRATTTLSAAVTFPLAGSQVINASVKARGLAGDDRMDAVVTVMDPIRTLLVGGNEQQQRSDATDDSTAYARAALAPYRSAQRRGNDPAAVESVGAGDLARTELANYQVIVLADVERVGDEAVARALDRFVSGGGGLFVSAAARINAETYNTSLFRNGSGPLPAALGPPSDEVLDAPFQIDDVTHPALQFLGGQVEMAPSGAVRRRRSAVPAAGAQVLARLASGEPLLIERAYGRGRVMLLTTSLGVDWGTLPQTAFYVPFLQAIVRHLATAGIDRPNLRIGEEIVATLDRPPQGRPTVTLPDGSSTAAADVVSLDARTQLRYTATQQPGTYTVRARVGAGTRVMPFVVRAGTEESDLTSLPGERWDRLASTLGFVRVDRAEEATPRTPVASAYGLWLPLVLSVVGVLIVEMGLSRCWSA